MKKGKSHIIWASSYHAKTCDFFRAEQRKSGSQRCLECELAQNRLSKFSSRSEDRAQMTALQNKEQEEDMFLTPAQRSDMMKLFESYLKCIKTQPEQERFALIKTQVKAALLKTPSSLRFSHETILFALRLFAYGKTAGYKAVGGGWTQNPKDGSHHYDGALILPSLRTLRDYKFNFKVQPGIHEDQILTATELEMNQREPIVVAFDGIKIREGVVYRNNELFGYEEDSDLLCNEIVQFMGISLRTGKKFQIAHFEKKLSSTEIFSSFWKLFHILEKKKDFTVLVACCDGASENRAFTKMCTGMS